MIKKGFSLIELLVVVAIIAILLALVAPLFKTTPDTNETVFIVEKEKVIDDGAISYRVVTRKDGEEITYRISEALYHQIEQYKKYDVVIGHGIFGYRNIESATIKEDHSVTDSGEIVYP